MLSILKGWRPKPQLDVLVQPGDRGRYRWFAWQGGSDIEPRTQGTLRATGPVRGFPSAETAEEEAREVLRGWRLRVVHRGNE